MFATNDKRMLSVCAGPSSISESMATGLPTIDEEHLGLLKSLSAAMINPSATSDLEHFGEVLMKIGERLRVHFKHEEAIMQALEIPLEVLARHVRRHDEILEQYAQLNMDLMLHLAPSHQEILAMLKEWIIAHVLDYDVMIRGHLPATCRA